METEGLQPNYVTWLLGQSGMVVVLVVWIWTLLREVRSLQRTNEKLQADLVQTIEKGMSERLRMAADNSLTQDSTFRNMLLSFERALTARQSDLEDYSDNGSRPPQFRR